MCLTDSMLAYKCNFFHIFFFEEGFLTYFHHKSYLKKTYKTNIYEKDIFCSTDCFYFFLPG